MGQNRRGGPLDGNPLDSSRISPEDQARFWTNVERTSGCWLWRGPFFKKADRSTGRYGAFGCRKDPSNPEWTNNQIQYRAHRVAFALVNGPILPRELVRHTCDVYECVRPDHLVKGSPLDNRNDAVERDRLDITGEKHPMAVLTEELVREIRLRHAAGETIADIARHRGVLHSAANDACCGFTWSHVPGAHEHESKRGREGKKRVAEHGQ